MAHYYMMRTNPFQPDAHDFGSGIGNISTPLGMVDHGSGVGAVSCAFMQEQGRRALVEGLGAVNPDVQSAIDNLAAMGQAAATGYGTVLNIQQQKARADIATELQKKDPSAAAAFLAKTAPAVPAAPQKESVSMLPILLGVGAVGAVAWFMMNRNR